MIAQARGEGPGAKPGVFNAGGSAPVAGTGQLQVRVKEGFCSFVRLGNGIAPAMELKESCLAAVDPDERSQFLKQDCLDLVAIVVDMLLGPVVAGVHDNGGHFAVALRLGGVDGDEGDWADGIGFDFRENPIAIPTLMKAEHESEAALHRGVTQSRGWR